jgi:hypothetical protein
MDIRCPPNTLGVFFKCLEVVLKTTTNLFVEFPGNEFFFWFD